MSNMDRDLPFITMAMTCYNAKDTIRRAVASADRQTWPNRETLLLDDGSADGSWGVIQNLARESPELQTFRHRKKGGYAAACNSIVPKAREIVMTISLFGLPGSGKTHLLSQLAQEDNCSVSVVPNRHRKRCLWAIRYALRNPTLTVSFLFMIILRTGCARELLYYKINSLFIPALAREESVSGKPDSIVDEGLFQLLLSIYDRKITKREAKSCLRILAKRNDRLWIVEADADTRQERMLIRSRIPRSRFGLVYVQSWLLTVEHNYRIFMEAIQEEREYLVLRSQDDVQINACNGCKGRSPQQSSLY